MKRYFQILFYFALLAVIAGLWLRVSRLEERVTTQGRVLLNSLDLPAADPDYEIKVLEILDVR